jgi:hypothetical protein
MLAIPGLAGALAGLAITCPGSAIADEDEAQVSERPSSDIQWNCHLLLSL